MINKDITSRQDYNKLVQQTAGFTKELNNECDGLNEMDALHETLNNVNQIIKYRFNLGIIMFSKQDVNALETTPYTDGLEDKPREYMQAIAFCVLKADVQNEL